MEKDWSMLVVASEMLRALVTSFHDKSTTNPTPKTNKKILMPLVGPWKLEAAGIEGFFPGADHLAWASCEETCVIHGEAG